MRFNSIDCPACSCPTLEWDFEMGDPCEVCGFRGEDADDEPAGLMLLRTWRGELAYPYVREMGSTPESTAILRQLRIENCAMMADLYQVPRVGAECEAVPAGLAMQSAEGGAHLAWTVVS